MTIAPARTPTTSPSRAARSARTADLFAQLVLTHDRAERAALRDAVVLANLEVARSVARRYRSRGVPTEDLEQVAFLALVKAAQHFDPSLGNDFLSYAVPSMRGEVRRHFRDLGWIVRPPRRIQELQQQIPDAHAKLAHALGRSPTVSEIAAELAEDRHDVAEALASGGCFHAVSLDKPVREHSSVSLGDLIGEEKSQIDRAEANLVLGPSVRRLAERDRHVLMLRFFHECTQQEIADDIGVTQMQVSRVLTRIFATLRADLTQQPEPAR